MAIQIKLPHLGENIETGQVVSILVEPGQQVEKDQSVLELETDKASIEIPAEAHGIVKKIHVNEGDHVAVGQVYMTLDEDEGSTPPPQSPKDDSSIPVVSTESAAPGESRDSNDGEPGNEELSVSPLPIADSQSQDTADLPAPAAPSTRRFAREIGVDINQVSGSGPGGRISIEDVKAHAKKLNARSTKTAVSSESGAKNRGLPDFEKWGAVAVKPMNNIRVKTAAHLSGAWSGIPHVTQFDKADITDLEKQRKDFSRKAETAGGKLTVTAILLKIIATALKRFPQFNASINSADNTIIYKKYYHIGIAVDTDRGLLVPVVRDVDKKNIIELSVELTQLAEKARNKQLQIEDMQGGNFTITNLGGIGGIGFTPIVNWPEIAILGIARAAMQPLYDGEQFVPRLTLPLALSYDHRVIDGADGARFLRWIVEALENPLLINLEG